MRARAHRISRQALSGTLNQGEDVDVRRRGVWGHQRDVHARKVVREKRRPKGGQEPPMCCKRRVGVMGAVRAASCAHGLVVLQRSERARSGAERALRDCKATSPRARRYKSTHTTHAAQSLGHTRLLHAARVFEKCGCGIAASVSLQPLDCARCKGQYGRLRRRSGQVVHAIANRGPSALITIRFDYLGPLHCEQLLFTSAAAGMRGFRLDEAQQRLARRGRRHGSRARSSRWRSVSWRNNRKARFGLPRRVGIAPGWRGCERRLRDTPRRRPCGERRVNACMRRCCGLCRGTQLRLRRCLCLLRGSTGCERRLHARTRLRGGAEAGAAGGRHRRQRRPQRRWWHALRRRQWRLHSRHSRAAQLPHSLQERSHVGRHRIRRARPSCCRHYHHHHHPVQVWHPPSSCLPARTELKHRRALGQSAPRIGIGRVDNGKDGEAGRTCARTGAQPPARRRDCDAAPFISLRR